MTDTEKGVVDSGRADRLEEERRAKLAKVVPRLKVFTIEGEDVTGEGGASSKKIADEDSALETYLRDGRLIRRPLDFEFLSELGEYSGTLSECVQAMEVNIDGFGHQIIPINPKDEAQPVKDEYARLVNFYRYAYLEGSFVDFRRRLRRDLEFTGNAYIEVIRDPESGEIVGFEHIASRDVWLGILSKARIRVEEKRLVLKPDGSHELRTAKITRRFRPKFQSKDGGVTGVWFKEFGDPRVFDLDSGEPVFGRAAEELPESKRANEIIHLRLYSPRSPYGMPRYVSQLLTVFGERAAEEVNYTTLKGNNIPSMLLLVANGMLTEGTIDRLNQFTTEARSGKKDFSRFVVVEAEGDIEGENTNVKINAVPLKDVQTSDELFQDYSKNNERKIRQAWRLPPLFIGSGEQYNRATAHVSRKLAEEQVFGPEREEFDRFINRVIMPQLEVVYHVFKSNSPNVTNDEDLIRVMQMAEKTGAMTPRIARRIIEDIMNQSLGDLPPEPGFPLDIPFTLTMAEKVKNKAAMSVPTQVAPESVEAVKSKGGVVQTTVETLLGIRRKLETELSSGYPSDVS